jgi:hypothetical protein
VAFIALLAAACEHLPTEAGSLASIVVTRNPDTVTVGARRQFIATGYDAVGTPVAISPTWSVVSGGTISNQGAFTAGNAPGTFVNSINRTHRHRIGHDHAGHGGECRRHAQSECPRDRRHAAVLGDSARHQ